MHILFNFKSYRRIRSLCSLPFLILGLSLSCLGLWLSFFGSPIDYQQKETVRIMYIHVPASWLALGIYAFMGLSSLGGFIWRHSLGFLYARAAWPVGFVMCIISLMTGSIWGKPMWGTWWVWDARLTSMFVLALLYFGYGLFMHDTVHDQKQYEKGSLFLIIGLINLPIIKFSVEWWSTLHQPASLLREGGIAIATQMLWPLFTSFFGIFCLCVYLGFKRVDTLCLQQKIRRLELSQDREVYRRQTNGVDFINSPAR